MLVKLVVVAAVVLAVYVVVKLRKAGKVVTAGSVADGVKSEVSAAVDKVKSRVGSGK